jgi:hypothetical protein
MSDYTVFQRPRPNWFAVNVVYRFRPPLQEGSEVYDATGQVIADPPDLGRAGLVVFSTTSRPSLFLPRLNGRVIALLRSWEERWNSLGQMARFWNRRNRPPSDWWFSIGLFYDGWYSSPDPFDTGEDFSPERQVYDDTCLAVQVVGITRHALLDLATALARDLGQREVLVFDQTGAIYTVNRRSAREPNEVRA